MPENPHPLHLVGGGRDASNAETELHRLRAEIEARNRQETAIAELGQAALTGVEPLIILGQACAIRSGLTCAQVCAPSVVRKRNWLA